MAGCTVPNPNYLQNCGSAHSQCASNVCKPDGYCALAEHVAYVDPSGTNGTLCTQEMPCISLQAALSTKRAYIKMAGTTDAHVSIMDQDVIVLADPGAKLTSKTAGNLFVIGGNSQVSIFDLIITGAVGNDNSGGAGVLLPAGHTATLSLERSTISNCEGSGLMAYSGIVNVAQSTISSNAIGGLGMEGGELHMTQSTVRNNGGAGINLKNLTAFDITNNFIYGNGTQTSNVGGLYLETNPNSTMANKIEFNTIVDNQASTAQPDGAGGVICKASGFVATNNLIFRNVGGPSNNPQVSGTCEYGNSLLTTPPNPGFASATDYHLTSLTPATIIDKGDCDGIKVDVDGDARPRGAACDLGADEFK